MQLHQPAQRKSTRVTTTQQHWTTQAEVALLSAVGRDCTTLVAPREANDRREATPLKPSELVIEEGCGMMVRKAGSDWLRRLVTPASYGDWLCRLVTATGCASWLWRLVMPTGYGDWLRQLVMETGYADWLWRLLTPAGYGDWLCRLVTATGCASWFWRLVLVIS